jgi:hypothetical protein
MPDIIRSPGQESTQRPHRLNRRAFLVSLSTLMVSSALGGRAFTERRSQQTSSPAASTPAFTTAEVAAVRPSEASSVDEFLRLSAVLTGVNVQDLNPDLGRLYLESLQARPNLAITLADLYDQAGFRSSAPPQSLDALAKSGVLAQGQLRSLADKIVEYWYTGLSETDSGPAVATFTDALAWKVLPWTKPPSFCGGAMGYWSEIPTMTF